MEDMETAANEASRPPDLRAEARFSTRLGAHLHLLVQTMYDRFASEGRHSLRLSSS